MNFSISRFLRNSPKKKPVFEQITVYANKPESSFVIKDKSTLDKLSVLISERQVVNLAETKLPDSITLDFVSDNRKYAGRWLYSKTGYIRILSKNKVPTYQIPQAQVFSKLLGIE